MKNFAISITVLVVVFIALAMFFVLDVPGFLSSAFNLSFTEIKDGQIAQRDKAGSFEPPLSDTEQTPLYRPVLDYETAVVSAVDSANPSVVSVVVTRNLPDIERCIIDPFLGDERCFFDEGRIQELGSGSGFIVSDDGLIVTNRHVVRDENADYTVLTNDGEQHNAEVLARDPFQDIAIMRIDSSDLTPLPLGNSDELQLGQTAIAIGNALGEFSNTVSVGVISGMGRNITARGGGGTVERLEGVLQTDAAINRGNSGGPLLNLRGEVIGVNTAVAIDAQNIGFAIPINRVSRAIESVMETGTIRAPFLGVRYHLITPELAREEDLPIDRGAFVAFGDDFDPGVLPGSAADEAGIQGGDIILEVDGVEINPEKSLALIIQKYLPGDEVELKILRDGEELTLQATLGEWDR